MPRPFRLFPQGFRADNEPSGATPSPGASIETLDGLGLTTNESSHCV
jgi:hypothetical protein